MNKNENKDQIINELAVALYSSRSHKKATSLAKAFYDRIDFLIKNQPNVTMVFHDKIETDYERELNHE
jgi:hypothetical protein